MASRSQHGTPPIDTVIDHVEVILVGETVLGDEMHAAFLGRRADLVTVRDKTLILRKRISQMILQGCEIDEQEVGRTVFSPRSRLTATMES